MLFIQKNKMQNGINSKTIVGIFGVQTFANSKSTNKYVVWFGKCHSRYLRFREFSSWRGIQERVPNQRGNQSVQFCEAFIQKNIGERLTNELVSGLSY